MHLWGEFRMIDPTITVGNIIEIMSILAGGLLVVFRMGGDIRLIKVDLTNLKTQVGTLTAAFDKLGTILTKVAVQDTRIGGLEEDKRRLEARLDDFAHGRGFIHSEIKGEWPRGG